ncbi:hypothetical protein BDR26DRAFT_876099, partial [Obelidium mucronatum]
MFLFSAVLGMSSLLLVGLAAVGILTYNINSFYNESTLMVLLSVVFCFLANIIGADGADNFRSFKQCICLWVVGCYKYNRNKIRRLRFEL